jgi:hypothetical protein
MKLKIQFGAETIFIVPPRPLFQSWAQFLTGTRLSFKALALAEANKRCKRHVA